MSDSKRYYVFCKHSSARLAPDHQRLSSHSNLSLALRQKNEREIAPVSHRLALAPDRFYLWLQVDFEREERSLLPLVEQERDRSVVLRVVESAIGSVA